jgi:hypothetical protein
LAYRFKTRLFDACRCLEDVQDAKLDPTGTAKIRRQFNTMLAIHWRRARVMVRQALVEKNLLGLSSGPANTAAVGASLSGTPSVQIFQRWIDSVLLSVVQQNDGMFVRPFIRSGYDAGVRHAENELGRSVVVTSGVDRIGTLSTLAFVELQGICEAVSQQAVRVVANGLLVKVSAPKLARQVQDIIDRVGVTRSTAMVELLVVKAFGEATLDVYESAGVTQVGLIPEAKAARRIGDARKTGPGSRSSRSRTPSRSTIGRIRRLEASFEGVGKVNVETAEDDKVCPICEDIADGGPYTINHARTLIPAHPRCRCIFVPV